MSLRPDGGYECDRCGTSVGNGGVDRCAVIADLDPHRPGTVRQLHLCLDRPDPDQPGKTIAGCRDRVLTKRALRHYHDTRS